MANSLSDPEEANWVCILTQVKAVGKKFVFTTSLFNCRDIETRLEIQTLNSPFNSSRTA